jgi:hypothetical protein
MPCPVLAENSSNNIKDKTLGKILDNILGEKTFATACF